MAVLHSASLVGIRCFSPHSDKWIIGRLISSHRHSMEANNNGKKATQCAQNCSAAIGSSTTSFSGTYGKSKRVWVWTENKEVMTTSVERGWNTFIFSSQRRELADHWSCKISLYIVYGLVK